MNFTEKVMKVANKLSFTALTGELDLNFKNPKYEEADLKVCFLQTGPWQSKMISATVNQLIALMREAQQFTGKKIYFDFSFRPDTKECAMLREESIPEVFGWNSFRSLDEFDVVVITLSIHFESITAGTLLQGAGIEPYFYDRLKNPSSPLVISGGVVAQHVEACMGHPRGALFDIVQLGEGEDRLTDVASALVKLQPRIKSDKMGVIKDLVTTFDNTYFPNGYQHIYDDSIPVEMEKEFQAKLQAEIDQNPISVEFEPPGVVIRDKSTKISAIVRLYPWVPEKVSYYRSYNTRPTMFEDKVLISPNHRAGRGELQISHGCSGRGACHFCSEGAEAGPWRQYDIEGIKRNLDELRVNDAPNSASYFSFNCLSGDTLVSHSKGFKKLSLIKKGDEVLTVGGKRSTSEGAVSNGIQEVFDIEFKSGKFLRGITANHCLMDTSGEKIKVSELAPGTRIVSQLGGWETTDLSFDREAYLSGLIYGDGWVQESVGNILVTLCRTEESLISLVESAYSEIDWTSYEDNSKENMVTYGVNSKPWKMVSDKMVSDKMGFDYKDGKPTSVTEKMLEWSPSSWASFIKGLYDTVGSYNGGRLVLSQRLERRPLIEVMCSALSCLGIRTTLRNVTVSLRGMKYPRVDVEIVGKDSWIKFKELIGFRVSKKQSEFERAFSRKSSSPSGGDEDKPENSQTWEQVKKVTPAGKVEVFDLLETTTGWFNLGLGVISHNSNYYSDTYGVNYELAKRFSTNSVIAFRADVVAETPDYLDFLRAIGNLRVTIALEGLSDRVRNKILNKNLSWERFLRCCEYAFKARYALLKVNLITTGYENEEDIDEFIWAMSEMDRLRTKYGANTSLVFSNTTLVHYMNVGIQWMPRRSAITNMFHEHLLEKAIAAGRKWNIRFKFHCLGEGERVLTDKGFKKIETITKGDRIFSSDGYTSHNGVVNQGKAPVVNLQTELGYSFVYTGNHLVSKDLYKPTEVYNLHKGDLLLCKRGDLKGTMEANIDPYILGLLSSFRCTEVENDFVFSLRPDHSLTELLKDYFGDAATIEIEDTMSLTVFTKMVISRENLEKSIGPENMELLNLLRSSKDLPEPVWQMEKEDLASFLAGCFDAVEYLIGAPKLWNAKFLKEIQSILLGFGIVTLRSEEAVPFVEILDAESKTRFKLNIPVKTRIIKDWIDNAYYGSVEQARDEQGKILKDFFYNKVLSIDPVTPRNVYDLVETQTGWFVHNGLVTHNSGKEFAWQQLQIDAGRAASKPSLDICHQAFKDNRNPTSLFGRITDETFKFMGIDSEEKIKQYFLRELSPEGVSPVSSFSIVPKKMEKQWAQTVGKEPMSVCLRTVANPDAKCSSCGFCSDPHYAKKYVWGRDYQTTKSLMDVEAAMFRNKPMSALRVSFVFKEGLLERYRHKIVHSHFVAGKVLQACKPLADNFYKCSNYADYTACNLEQDDCWGGVSCLDIETRLFPDELKKVVEEYSDKIFAKVGAEVVCSRLTGIRVVNYPSTFKNHVAVWRFVSRDSKHSLSEMVQTHYDGNLKVWKSLGMTDTIEDVPFDRKDLNLYMTQTPSATVGYFTTPTRYNPLMTLFSMFGLSQAQVKERFVLSRAALIDVVGSVCPSCGQAAGVDVFTGNSIKLCPGCISKLLTMKVAKNTNTILVQ